MSYMEAMKRERNDAHRADIEALMETMNMTEAEARRALKLPPIEDSKNGLTDLDLGRLGK